MAKTYEEQEQLRQTQLQNALNGQNQAAPTYAGTYENQLADIYDKIQNRQPFQYDVNADPLYQQYKDQYVQGGKLAMKDTMGQAAALTGGYGSSYGQQVGQQSYNAYLQDLTAKIPELYNMAYGMYQDKGNELQNQYSMLGQMRDTEYNQYRDQLSDYNYNQELARQLEESEYGRQQTAFSNLVALIQASGYSPTDDELTAAGMTREAANALVMNYMMANGLIKSGGGRSGGGRGGSSGGGAGSDSAEDILGNYSWSAMMDAVKNGATFADISRAIMSETGLSADQQRMLQQRASDVVTGNLPSVQAENGRNAAIAASQAYNQANPGSAAGTTTGAAKTGKATNKATSTASSADKNKKRTTTTSTSGGKPGLPALKVNTR